MQYSKRFMTRFALRWFASSALLLAAVAALTRPVPLTAGAIALILSMTSAGNIAPVFFELRHKA